MVAIPATASVAILPTRTYLTVVPGGQRRRCRCPPYGPLERSPMKSKVSIDTNEWSSPMSKSSLMCVIAGFLYAFTAPWPALGAEGTKGEAASIPNFTPDSSTAWTLDRPAHDDFLPPPSGPGPVTYDKAHPYVPNGQGQPTYRVADLTNPILKPWLIERMRKANEEVLAGKVPFIARERCWPAGVPGLDIYNRGQPVHFIQTPKMAVDINDLYAQMRHIYTDVPHSEPVTP